MQIETRKLADLRPAEYNPRKKLAPGDPEYEKIARSIEDFGYCDPIMIASRMRKPNGKGSWMVYKDTDLEYCEQVTAEHKVVERNANGRETQRWVLKTSHADNHYLDTEVYAMAAADVRGVRTLFLQNGNEQEAPPTMPPANQEGEKPWIITPTENWL